MEQEADGLNSENPASGSIPNGTAKYNWSLRSYFRIGKVKLASTFPLEKGVLEIKGLRDDKSGRSARITQHPQELDSIAQGSGYVVDAAGPSFVPYCGTFLSNLNGSLIAHEMYITDRQDG